MYRQTIIFLLPHQITTVQKNNKPEQSIKSNNQKKQSKISQSKTPKKQTVKTNTTNYLTNQS